MPQMFGTITISDGISMNRGMKYSLVSREVIAFDRQPVRQRWVLAIGGCDMPGAMIAIARRTSPQFLSTAPSNPVIITGVI